MSEGSGNQEERQDPVDAKLRATLRFLRRREKLSQTELAQAVRVERTTVWRIERGLIPISVTTFRLWCDAVGEKPAHVLKFAEKHGAEPQQTG